MFFKPHILQIYVPGITTTDPDGNPVTTKGTYQNLDGCRCDDNGAQRSVGVSGQSYVYNQHVVLSKTAHKFSIGEQIRVINKDGSIRAEGTIIKTGEANYHNYSEIYL